MFEKYEHFAAQVDAAVLGKHFLWCNTSLSFVHFVQICWYGTFWKCHGKDSQFPHCTLFKGIVDVTWNPPFVSDAFYSIPWNWNETCFRIVKLKIQGFYVQTEHKRFVDCC